MGMREGGGREAGGAVGTHASQTCLFKDQINGTTHVDINKVYIGFLLDELGTLRHRVRVATTNLSCQGMGVDGVARKKKRVSRPTWTPKMSSEACRFKRAHSEGLPLRRFIASAISPHVISTPNSLQMRRNGRLPTVVRGAKYSFPARSIYPHDRGNRGASSLGRRPSEAA